MAHTYASILLHIVFSTKGRLRQIPAGYHDKLRRWMIGVGKNKGFTVLETGGVEDHIHVLLLLPATLDLSKVVQALKTNSSRYMHDHGLRFAWQQGYSAFSVSESNKSRVIEYIRTQPEHHRRVTFEQEYLALLQKHGIKYDPEYVLG